VTTGANPAGTLYCCNRPGSRQHSEPV